MGKQIYTCKHCGRKYEKKLYYEKHVLGCEILMMSCDERRIDLQHRDDTPTHRRLFELVTEMAVKVTKLESELTELKRLQKTQEKEKIKITDWLNRQYTPTHCFNQWIETLPNLLTEKHLEHIYEHDHIEGLLNIMYDIIPSECHDNIPLRSFNQKDNELYIFKNNEWCSIEKKDFTKLEHIITKCLHGFYISYSKENAHKILNFNSDYGLNSVKQIQKIYGTKFKPEQISSRLKKGLYKHIKKNIKTLTDCEMIY